MISIPKPFQSNSAPHLLPHLHSDRFDVQPVGAFTVIVNPAMPPNEVWLVGQDGQTIKQKVKPK